ncbi:hypothetical protein HRI_000935100 [Hibiscus trionum]|uniref:Uncharacterized protein n=1 Tax=Hibiscus trionum TaxID=183268 RepID=A0A9W7H8J4_HIBTR|nr:hypothetical protein HRI_000935100 [Hibiscus trionum]
MLRSREAQGQAMLQRWRRSIKSIEIKPPLKPPAPVPTQAPALRAAPSSPKPAPAPAPIPTLKPPEPCPLPPMGCCCTECYHSMAGGPCYYGGPPPLKHPCYVTYGRPVYDSLAGDGSYNSYCYSHGNPQGCSLL